MSKKSINQILFLFAILGIVGCANEVSQISGWSYNDPRNGGFEVGYYDGQETGPGLILVQGGTFMAGRVENDVTYDWDNIPRRLTVSSFYMDETEVANVPCQCAGAPR